MISKAMMATKPIVENKLLPDVDLRKAGPFRQTSLLPNSVQILGRTSIPRDLKQSQKLQPTDEYSKQTVTTGLYRS